MSKDITMVVYHSQVTGKDCIGCLRHKRDIMMSLSTDNEDYDVSDFFLSNTQAIELASKLMKKVRQNEEDE